MRIAVVGAGGVGGGFGAALAKAGADVTFIARGAHLAAMRARGLEVRTDSETFRLSPVRAVGTPAEATGGFGDGRGGEVEGFGVGGGGVGL